MPGMRLVSEISMRTCGLCGGGSTFARYVVGSHSIVRCRTCTFMWLDPQPSAADLREVYGASYYRNEAFFEPAETVYGYHDYAAERLTRLADLRRVLNAIADLLGSSGRRPSLLDVGCGLGYLLEAAAERGFDVAGIDCNEAAIEWVGRRYQFSASLGDFVAYEGEQRDVLSMLDVIEHLPRPFEALTKAASLIRPGGLLVIATMDADALVSRLLGRRLEDFRRTREHLYFFNRRTIAEAVGRAGFDVRRIDSYGLTIRMDSLAKRAGLALPRVGALMERGLRWLGVADRQFYFDPRTKFVLYARRPVS